LYFHEDGDSLISVNILRLAFPKPYAWFFGAKELPSFDVELFKAAESFYWLEFLESVLMSRKRTWRENDHADLLLEELRMLLMISSRVYSTVKCIGLIVIVDGISIINWQSKEEMIVFWRYVIKK
jgi:hypothetical protein